jgi:hypothetical protein
VAIDYALDHMAFLEGYAAFVQFRSEREIQLAIISTGYSVTLYAIRHGTQTPPFHVHCNRLLFADSDDRVLQETELENLVRHYIVDKVARQNPIYDQVLATGQVILGIRDEADKADLALEIARTQGLLEKHVAHMGDTMGDSGGILGVARAGGLGIAFNYNSALEAFLRSNGAAEIKVGRIVLLDAKGSSADLSHVLPLLNE